MERNIMPALLLLLALLASPVAAQAVVTSTVGNWQVIVTDDGSASIDIIYNLSEIEGVITTHLGECQIVGNDETKVATVTGSCDNVRVEYME